MEQRDVFAAQQSPRQASPRPGPRQEYVDAFDDAHFGRIPVQRESPQGHSSPGGRDGQAEREAGAGDSGGGRRAGSRLRRRESWGRTLAGLASAAVVTVLVVVAAARIAGGGDGGEQTAPPVPAPQTREPQARGPEAPAETSEPPERPPAFEELMGTPFEMDPDFTGSGELAPVPGSDPAPDPDAQTIVRYRVDVETGLGMEMEPEFFAEAVHRTLNDDRSWTNDGERSFARVSRGEYDFVVTLASPGTTADWCARSGLDVTVDNVSCNSSATERVMINAWRWARGSETYGDDIHAYRQMLINHEVGHRLGYDHQVCPEEGALAPVMMQQTKFLTIDGVTCRANPWPHPEN
ncbi:DUF3152 domain-containing protein [Streptomyces sp. 7-21]|uniref:DUF3152 domain-containing protein n=1 Tax=Streptomyces sp. 7-21 TaxID=2802283 RepID=UPI00191F73FE|nr:DUF3152 domain-containing protein [Streptomyces sp. 7-21]MBL1066306.1 DUF3152 domain-containing protein [Streptomyces sp. 7-21]